MSKKHARKRKTASAVRFPLLKSPYSFLVLIVLGLIYYYKILSPNVMVFATDQITAGYAFRLFHANVLKTLHKIPFWNPYLFSGLPFIDAFHGDIFYPLSFLRLIFPVHVVLNWFFIIHTILAGIFMFLFLRELKLEAASCLLFSISYMFAGSIVSLTYPGHDAKVAIAALLPLVFYCLRRGMREENYRWFFLGSIPLGLGLLAPHVQMMYYLYMAVFFYFLYEGYFKLRERGTGTFFKLLVAFGLMVLISLLIGAVQLLPAYEYVSKFSPRAAGHRGYEFAITWSLPWEDYLSAFFAKFSGYMNSYWGRNPFKINTEYVGVFASLFAIFAFSTRREKDPTAFFAFLFVFFSIMALGGYTPIYKLFYALLPGVKKFRASSMSFYIVAFSINVLAAIGLSKLRNLKNSAYLKKVGIATGVIFFIGLAALVLKPVFASLIKSIFIRSDDKLNVFLSNYSQVPAAFLRFGIIGGIALFLFSRRQLKEVQVIIPAILLILIDLWSVDWNFLKTVPHPDWYYREDGVVRFLKKDNDVYRVFPLFYKVDDNYLMVHGIESIGGHHGNQFQRYQEYVGDPKHFMFRPHQVPNLLRYPAMTDLLNVKYVVTQPIPEDLTPYTNNPSIYSLLSQIKSFLDTTHFELVNLVRSGNASYAIYRNKNFIPRVFFVDSFEVHKKENALQRLKQADYDPRKIAILEEKPGFTLHPDTATLEYNCKFISRTPDYVKLEVSVNRPAFLIYLENFYPKFEAFVDGKRTKCYRTDYLFRGVFIDSPGKHVIEFRFRGREYNILGLISILSAALAITLCVLMKRKPKR